MNTIFQRLRYTSGLVLLGIVLGGCAQNGVIIKRIDPVSEALIPARADDMQQTIANLYDLLRDPRFQCRASYYLFALGEDDPSVMNDILFSEECRKEIPEEILLVERLLASEEELDTCLKKTAALSSKGKRLKRPLAALRNENENLRETAEALSKENERLRYEIEKMEEIRRETEQLRLNRP